MGQGPGQCQSGLRPALGQGAVFDGTDPLIAIGIQTLSQAVEMLREDLAIANGSLVAERERVEHAERELETERQLRRPSVSKACSSSIRLRPYSTSD